MEQIFHLKERNTTVTTELLAGLSTFLTMAYIIALNPNLLTNFAVGTPLWNGVFLATILSAAVGTLLMAFLASRPFALAPGMGLNTYFVTMVTSIAVAAGISYEEAFPSGLAVILLSGILFTILTLLRIREQIVAAIPKVIRLNIPASIGFMLLSIGLTSNAAVYTADGGSYTVLGSLLTLGPSATSAAMGDAYPKLVLYAITMFVGLLIVVACRNKVKGAILLGMLGAACFYWAGCFLVLQENPFLSLSTASFIPPFADMFQTTFMKFDFQTILSLGYFATVMTVVSFCMVDMFDTIGGLIGIAKCADLLDQDGNLPDINRAMLADSLATCVGACTGTSTVTTYIESSAGVEAGGRTGLTSVTTAVLFLGCMFLSPIAALMPAPATSVALIYVGAMMMGSLKEVDYADTSQAIPVALCLLSMVITGGVDSGIGSGLISYSAIQVCTGKGKELSPLTIVLSLLFVGKFFIIY